MDSEVIHALNQIVYYVDEYKKVLVAYYEDESKKDNIVKFLKDKCWIKME